MPADSAQQKTEKPTQRRRQKAREEGQVCQSSEVGNALTLLAIAGGLALFGGTIFRAMLGRLQDGLGAMAFVEVNADYAPHLVSEMLQAVARAVFPTVCFVAAVGTLASVGQTGFLYAPSVLRLRLEALDPAKGFRRLLSLHSAMKLLVAIAKLAVIASAAWFAVRPELARVMGLMDQTPWAALALTERVGEAVLLRMGVAMLAIAVLDYAWERRRFEKQLMMTRAELKEERKRDEGHPEVKGRMTRLRYSLVNRRMMQAVPKATVVVTNPTHLAVALQWQESMSAPKVVAKGKGYLAERIKQIARAHRVPVLERRALARALYDAVEVGMSIPPRLYLAVARLLAFVLKRR